MAAPVTLYLEDWQKRMIRDFAGIRAVDKIDRMILKWGRSHCPASYKIPIKGMRPGDWLLYLTDAQIAQVRRELGLRTAVSSLNVTLEDLEKGTIAFT